ncbi:MAG: hypothetical protein AAGF79_09230 [Pseudomonadota bacterium]
MNGARLAEDLRSLRARIIALETQLAGCAMQPARAPVPTPCLASPKDRLVAVGDRLRAMENALSDLMNAADRPM